jgi:hypothetical protein
MNKMSRTRTLACIAVALLLALPCLAQEAPRRLILKDGSYQIVTKYEVKGDRVRYYSSEREDWEELPNALVDWPATEKLEKDRAAAASTPEAVQLDKELEHERQLEEAELPQVAPGLRLPEPAGVFLLDNYQGEPQIVEVNQSAGDVNRNTKANIFRGTINPVAGLKQTIELEGAHATVQSHVDVPALYMNVDETSDHGTDPSGVKADSAHPGQPQQPQQPQQAIVPFNRFHILRVEVKGNKRIVGDVKRQVTGKVTHEQKEVKTTITGLRGGWLKLTPTENLPPGEYALVEMTEKEGMNLYVWDFGVNPKAPANPNPWKPDLKPASRPAQSKESPK